MTLTPAELKAHRLRLGLSQTQLARYLGTSPNTLARWERGEMTMPVPNALDRVLRVASDDPALDAIRADTRPPGRPRRATE